MTLEKVGWVIAFILAIALLVEILMIITGVKASDNEDNDGW